MYFPLYTDWLISDAVTDPFVGGDGTYQWRRNIRIAEDSLEKSDFSFKFKAGERIFPKAYG